MAAEARMINKRRERLFYTGMSVACLITVFGGFAPTYYLRTYFQDRPLIPLLHLHGFIFSLWLLLLITQTVLAATNRTRIHRRLGIGGAVVAVLMILIGTTTAIIRAKVIDIPPGSSSPLIF